MGDSMSNTTSRQTIGATVRAYNRRKRGLDLDLNIPPSDNRDQGETSIQVNLQQAQDRQQRPSDALTSQEQQPILPPTMIDIETLDDDVIESSATAFAEAKNKSRRNGGRAVVDVDAEEQNRITHSNRNKRRRAPPNQTIINCDLYINLEGSNSSSREKVVQSASPPKEPTFNCPICMGPLAEEMSTKCGHIFCKACIKAAITAQGKCPTCRKKVTTKELIRVFLPAMS